MRDSDVRAVVRSALWAEYGDDPNTRIVEEMGIWSGSVRVDLAVINGELHGFELKSERDTLARLESQAELYNQVFDRVTLVAAKRHVDKAIPTIPDWWGIACVTMSINQRLELCVLRPAERNPAVDPIQLARLLWRTEALAILERRGVSRGFRSRSANTIATRLAQLLPLDLLATEVRETLKARTDWLGQAVGDKRKMPVCDEPGPDRSATAAGGSASDGLDTLIGPTPD